MNEREAHGAHRQMQLIVGEEDDAFKWIEKGSKLHPENLGSPITRSLVQGLPTLQSGNSSKYCGEKRIGAIPNIRPPEYSLVLGAERHGVSRP